MKKLSLFSLLGLAGLLAFVATPIYAQDEDINLDDEQIVAEAEDIVDGAEDIADGAEDIVEDSAIIDDEFDFDEEDYALETTDEEIIEDEYDSDDWSMYFDDDLTSSSSFEGLSLSDGGISGETMAWILGLGFGALIIGYLFLVYFTLFPISRWEIYRKAGKKGWAFLIPFWGTMVYSEIAGMSKWLGLVPWLLTICAYLVGVIPAGVYSVLMIVLGIASLIWGIVANYRIARRYGWGVFASVLHAIIILMPITILVLGLGNYKYQGKSEETVVEA